MNVYIAGVYNYCDRWCERCLFSGRCAVHARSVQQQPDPESSGLTPGPINLTENFAEAGTLLEEPNARFGFDDPKPTEEELAAWRKERADRKDLLDRMPLIQACAAYADAVDSFLQDPVLWKEKGRSLAQETILGIRTHQSSLAIIDRLSDAYEVIAWYQHFIGVKFRRAFIGRLDDPIEAEHPRSDSLGSARIALLAVARSRDTLTGITPLLPDIDPLLPMLSALERIDKLGKEAFPNALRFVRPGFDEASG